MAGYSDTRQLIIDTLMGRPSGTEIQPEDHQAFALALNDYIRSVELVAGSGVPVAFAEPDTVPIQPNNGQAVYLSQVPCDSSKTFSNFIGQDGNALSVSSAENEVKLVTLLWNGSYWSKQETSIPVVTDTTSGFVFKGVAEPDTVPKGKFVNCRFVSLEDTKQPVEIGLHNSQELILEKCSFIPLHGYGVYCHNWNNSVDSSRLSIKDSYFKYDYLVLGELGSERNTFIDLNNCVSGKDDATMSIFVESREGGVSYWNDPETGEPTTDLTQVPYNLMINVVGTDVHGVSLTNRPRALDYIVGKIL